MPRQDIGLAKLRIANHHLKVILKLGSRCIKCGFGDYRALQVDHVNGRRDGKRYTNFTRILEELNKGYTDYQLLCANCNWIKRWENHEVPHNR